jgi:diaminopimelate epimerase
MATTRIERYRGDSHNEVFTITDAAGAAVNLTSASARFTVKRHVTDAQADAIITRTSAVGGGITIAAATGVVTVAFVQATMAALDPGRYVYDLEVTLSDGTVHTVPQDEFHLLADVST